MPDCWENSKARLSQLCQELLEKRGIILASNFTRYPGVGHQL